MLTVPSKVQVSSSDPKICLCLVTTDLRMWLSVQNRVCSCATAALVLLVSKNRVDAFGIAAPGVGNGAAAAGDSSNPKSLPKRVTILPDSRAEVSDTNLWYHHLKASC